MISSTFKHRYSAVLDNWHQLDAIQREVIKDRYISVVTHAENDYRRATFLYISLTNIITIAGVLVTAFVSFDRISSTTNNTSIATSLTSQIFLWLVWILGILLSVCNGLLYTFNIPKKYVLNIAILEKLYSEGWSFIAGIGRYKTSDIDARFERFCSRIEKIKMKSVETLPEMGSNEGSEILRDETIRDDTDETMSNKKSSRRSKKSAFVIQLSPRTAENILARSSEIIDMYDNIMTDDVAETGIGNPESTQSISIDIMNPALLSNSSCNIGTIYAHTI